MPTTTKRRGCKTQFVGVWIEPEHMKKLKAAARRADRSISAYARLVLLEAVKAAGKAGGR